MALLPLVTALALAATDVSHAAVVVVRGSADHMEQVITDLFNRRGQGGGGRPAPICNAGGRNDSPALIEGSSGLIPPFER